MSSGAKPVWVFPTPTEKRKKEYIGPVKMSGAIPRMVWGCFAGGEKGPMADLMGDPESSSRGVTGEVAEKPRS